MAIVGQNALLNQYVPTFYIKDLRDGQTVRYDSVRKAFVNSDTGGGGGGATRLGELDDVSSTVDNPLSLQNGQALVYNSFTSQWENKFTDYNTLLNKPVIPTNGSFSFVGLSDTATPSLPDGYVRWNSAGTQLVYSTTIPAASISGLATVATTGDYNDLSNASWKQAVHVLADTNIPLTGGPNLTIDGSYVDNEYRVLLINQSLAAQNGIYTVSGIGSAYILTRSTDADTNDDIIGATVMVMEGDLYTGSGWFQNNHYISGFAIQNWVQFTGANYTEGTGISILGDVISVSDVPILNGGTGATTRNEAINNLLPSQAGNAGKILVTDGTDVSWVVGGSTGTVTSVSATGTQGVTTLVLNGTTTPSLTIGLGNITPTGVASTGTVTGSNLSGINTGDNAVNSLYSGLVSNATHTGDATGATVLTLATVNASPQTDAFRKVTVNAKGLVTATSAIVPSDIITALGFTPYNATNPAGYTTNTGTVTTVSVVTANGVSGSVATANTTPAITLTLGAITPSSVAATGTVTGSNLSGTHTGTSSGTNTGDQTITLTGDVTGSGTGSFATALATVNATPGTYADAHFVPTITVNAKGLVTSITTQHVDTTVRDLIETADTITVAPRHQYIVTGVLEVEGYIVNNGVIAIL